MDKIVAYKASLNLGLSDRLKESFPGVVPLRKPLVIDKVIRDPYWVAGFTSAEGCFFLDIYKSKTKIGEAVKLTFFITQHLRDEQLMRSLIGYFECGNIFFNKEKVNFTVQKYSDLTYKIIPFFKKYPILGEKSKDFSDLCQAGELMKTKTHLTLDGLDKIRKLKFGMNRHR